MKDKTAKDIAMRALVLGCLSTRSQMENHARVGDRERSLQVIHNHRAWVRHFSVAAHMEAEELALIEEEPGTWDEEAIRENFWKIESFNALYWVLGQCDSMPPFYRLGDIEELYRRTQYPKDPRPFIEGAGPRHIHEILAEFELSRFLNWRCRMELQKLEDPDDAETDYPALVRSALAEIPKGRLEVDDQDILIEGVPFGLYEDLGTVFSTCYERHLALSWVLTERKWRDVQLEL